MSEKWVKIDRQQLERLHQAIGDDFQPLIPAYIEQSDNFINMLNKSYEQRDMDVFIRSAHSLKSSSSNLGALQLSEYSRQLEEAALEDAANPLLEPLIELINNEYPDVKQALQDYLRKL